MKYETDIERTYRNMRKVAYMAGILTTDQVAEYLNMSKGFVLKLVKKQELHPIRFNEFPRRYLFVKTDVKAFIDRTTRWVVPSNKKTKKKS